MEAGFFLGNIADRATAQQLFLPIKSRELARRNGPLRLIKEDIKPTLPSRHDLGNHRLMTITDSNLQLARQLWGITGQPAQLCNMQPGAKEVLLFTDYHPVARRFKANHIPGGCIGDAQTTPLPHRETMNALMLADHAVIDRDHRPRTIGNSATVTKEIRNLLILQKADILALFTTAELKAKFRSQLIDLILPIFSEGEPDPGQLLLLQLAEKIRLVLGWIIALEKMIQAIIITLPPDIMTGSQKFSAAVQSPIHEKPELDLTVTDHTWVGGQAPEITVPEIIQDQTSKLLMQIDNGKFYLQPVGHGPDPGHLIFDVRLGQGHKNALNLVALFFEQGSRYRTVHPTAHGHCHFFLSHLLFKPIKTKYCTYPREKSKIAPLFRHFI